MSDTPDDAPSPLAPSPVTSYARRPTMSGEERARRVKAIWQRIADAIAATKTR